jgi:hypothetical protein
MNTNTREICKKYLFYKIIFKTLTWQGYYFNNLIFKVANFAHILTTIAQILTFIWYFPTTATVNTQYGLY